MRKYITVELSVETTRTDDETSDMIQANLRTLFLSTEVRRVNIVDISEEEDEAHKALN